MGTNVTTKAAPPKAVSEPAFRTFLRIAERWGLSVDEQTRILGLKRATYFNRKEKGGALSPDTLERISYILGIYKALQILLPDQSAADGWVRRPNTAPPFGGKPALARMLSGHVADLFVVRRYLDGQRGGWA